MKEEKGIEGTQGCAQIPLPLNSHLNNERHIAQAREITEYVPDKILAWKSTNSRVMKYAGQFIFEAVGEGTRISYTGSAQLGGFWRLIEPLAALEAKNETKAELEKIKSVLEV